jgi:hypothetical protein
MPASLRAHPGGRSEALRPSRCSGSLVDPGHEQFLHRREKGDADTEPARREARTVLQRLRDQPMTRRP